MTRSTPTLAALHALALSLGLLLGTALAAIGEPPASLLEALAPYDYRSVDDDRYETDNGFRFGFETRSDLVYQVTGQGVLDPANIAFAADLIGAASGYGEGISEPVATFFETRVGELSGQGPVVLGVQEYLLRIEVTGDGPFTVSFVLELQEVPADAFPEARHSLGPADARYVIREFSDFQCPFCQRFASAALPQLKDQLLARGDVRFEYHHFPLPSIHANAIPAAEASECVAEAAGNEGFWRFHDALFERQQAWQDLGDPGPYFSRLADDLGVGGEEVAACIVDRRFAEMVEQDYQIAGGVLRLTGTPTLFVNGYKVTNYLDLDAYLELFTLADAFGAGE